MRAEDRPARRWAVVRLGASNRLEFFYERVPEGACPAEFRPLTAPG
ncbi:MULTISPECIES: hypothetical protein [unclassified Saccharothrix]